MGAGYAKDAAKPVGTGTAEDAAWCAVGDLVGIAGCAPQEEQRTSGWWRAQEDDERGHDRPDRELPKTPETMPNPTSPALGLVS